MLRGIAGIFALIILITAGIYGLEFALADAGDDIVVNNETFTSDPGSVTLLEYSNSDGAYYADSQDVTVYNVSSGADVELEDGVDYEWIADNGTVKSLTGGGLDPATDAKISYSLQQTTAEQRSMAGVLALMPQAFALAIPVFFVILFLKFLT